MQRQTQTGLALLVVMVLGIAGCRSHDPLPGPAIDTVWVVPAGRVGRALTGRSHGVLELYLTPADPVHTIWNDPLQQSDAWGTVTLVGVAEDGAVTITLGGETLTARVGRSFPGTGIRVIASGPGLGTALLRSRWTRTAFQAPPDVGVREVPSEFEYGEDGPLLDEVIDALGNELGELEAMSGSDHHGVYIYNSSDMTYRIVIVSYTRHADGDVAFVVSRITRQPRTDLGQADR